MSTPRGHRVDAIVVRTVDFAETSQVVHLVTAQGLVAALAKGARSPKGAFQGGLTLGVLGEADLLPRRGADLELLRAFRVTDGLRGLHDDLDRFDVGGRILALVRDLARPGLANETLFLAAVTTLKALATSPPALAPTWGAVFEARALASTGHRPHLASCVLCGQPLARDVVFAAAAGGAAHRRCGPTGPLRALSAADLAALDRLYTARLPALASKPLSGAELRAVHAVHALFLPYAFEGSGAVARAMRR